MKDKSEKPIPWYVNALVKIAVKYGLISEDDIPEAEKAISQLMHLVTTQSGKVNSDVNMKELFTYESLLSMLNHFAGRAQLGFPENKQFSNKKDIKLSNYIDDATKYKNKDAIAKINFMLIPSIIDGYKAATDLTPHTTDFMIEEFVGRDDKAKPIYNSYLKIGGNQSLSLQQLKTLEFEHITSLAKLETRLPDINDAISFIKEYLSEQDQIGFATDVFDYKTKQKEVHPFVDEVLKLNPTIKTSVIDILTKEIKDSTEVTIKQLYSYIKNIEYLKASDNPAIKDISQALAKAIARKVDAIAMSDKATIEDIKYWQKFYQKNPKLKDEQFNIIRSNLDVQLVENIDQVLETKTMSAINLYKLLKNTNDFNKIKDKIQSAAFKQAFDATFEDLKQNNETFSEIFDKSTYKKAYELLSSLKFRFSLIDSSDDFGFFTLKKKIKDEVVPIIENEIKNIEELKQYLTVLQSREFNLKAKVVSSAEKTIWDTIIVTIQDKAISLAKKESSEELKKHAQDYNEIFAVPSTMRESLSKEFAKLQNLSPTQTTGPQKT